MKILKKSLKINDLGLDIIGRIEAEHKAKVVLQEMHGKDFSEYGFRNACIKAETQLQNVDKDRSYESGFRIR